MNYKFLDYLQFAMRAINATKSTGEVTNLQRKEELLEEAISWLVLAKKLNEERLERLGTFCKCCEKIVPTDRDGYCNRCENHKP